MHISKILGPLEKIESQLSELYLWFSTLFRDDPEAARLFEQMSLDETVHANLVRYERRLVARDPKSFKDVEVDAKALDETLAAMSLIRLSPPPTLEKAVEFALTFENGAAEQHSVTAIVEANAEMSKLLSSLFSFDCRHITHIYAFAQRRGFAIAIKQSDYVQSLLRCAHPKEIPAETSDSVTEDNGLDPEIAKRIDELYAGHDKMTFYAVLKLKDYASSNQIRQAYYRMAREFHPDRYPRCSKEYRHKLGSIFSYLHDAYLTLIEPQQRQEYDRTLMKRVRY